ncbi:MAG: YceD family protein, partial [Acidimicrobiales bacterium]
LLESYLGGIMVTGMVAVGWVGVCRRCTIPVKGRLDISLKERCCDPPGRGEPEDEDAYRILDDEIDLAVMVHEAILADLPLAPLCREDCAGLCGFCGIDRNEETCTCVAPRDPRWASLDVLRSTS